MIINPLLEKYLTKSTTRHSHLCPRQVLGVRMGLAGLRSHGMESPPEDKSLIVICEGDGCFVDGIEVTTGVNIGRRTLRIHDFGKVAAVFSSLATRKSYRIRPSPRARELARQHFPAPHDAYQAMLKAYQIIPDADLCEIVAVRLDPGLEELLSLPGLRVTCERCGEEVINARQLIREGQTLCRPCAGDGYYHIKN